jgi:hypothetical protein
MGTKDADYNHQEGHNNDLTCYGRAVILGVRSTQGIDKPRYEIKPIATHQASPEFLGFPPLAVELAWPLALSLRISMPASSGKKE